jgi:hypothetical protein
LQVPPQDQQGQHHERLQALQQHVQLWQVHHQGMLEAVGLAILEVLQLIPNNLLPDWLLQLSTLKTRTAA